LLPNTEPRLPRLRSLLSLISFYRQDDKNANCAGAKYNKRQKMKVYLDNCTFNRPFDDQSYIRVKIETEAKLYVQEKIKDGELELVWSYILDFENEQNPYDDRKNAIKKWKRFACVDIEETSSLLAKAKKLKKIGLKAKDALHVASAIEGNAHYFLTTDDKILKKLSKFPEIQVIDPIEFVKVFENYDS